MEPNDQLAVIIPVLIEIVDHIEVGQLADATPCAEFTVRDVLDHMIGLATAYVPAFRGESVAPPPVESATSGVPATAFRDAMLGLLAAVQAPGSMDRSIDAPFGRVPGSVFARFVAFDGLVHGWDLARSTGQSYDISEEVVTAVDGFIRDALVPEMRDGQTFAAETSPPRGASPMERVVAFSGRTV